jgi:hypothetical protein
LLTKSAPHPEDSVMIYYNTPETTKCDQVLLWLAPNAYLPKHVLTRSDGGECFCETDRPQLLGAVSQLLFDLLRQHKSVALSHSDLGH